MKLYTLAHGHKTTNLIINLDHDEWILNDLDKTLVEVGVRELSPTLRTRRHIAHARKRD